MHPLSHFCPIQELAAYPSYGHLLTATKTFLKKTEDNFQTKGIGELTMGCAGQGKCLFPSAQH